MEERFSRRNGHEVIPVDLNDVRIEVRERIWGFFSKYEIEIKKPNVRSGEIYTDLIEEALSYFGIHYSTQRGFLMVHDNCCTLLHKYLLECDWFTVYDFIEWYCTKNKDAADQLNKILEDEKTGYRIINNKVVPITNELELHEIRDALGSSEISPYNSVYQSLSKAVSFYSDRENPNYNNAITEAITAVESLLKIIVGDNETTLGKAIDKLDKNGVILHKDLKEGLKKIYHYTCDEHGKRHGGSDYVESEDEDARFMLIFCSSIINFLITKNSKVKVAS